MPLDTNPDRSAVPPVPLLPARTNTPSPGPWAAQPNSPTVAGAIPIWDLHGNLVGWATDTDGHTSETALPKGRHPDDIARNARLMAIGSDAVALCQAVRRALSSGGVVVAPGTLTSADLQILHDQACGILRKAGVE
ncbi:MAG: hypothetical protein AB7F35_06525 [Acetobacteraceae bacterium]